MREVRVSLNARIDLLRIGEFVARDSERAALRLIASLEARFQFLGASPMAGRARPDLRRGARAWAVGSYLVIYKARPKWIEILRVIHGRRDVGSAIRHPPTGRA